MTERALCRAAEKGSIELQQPPAVSNSPHRGQLTKFDNLDFRGSLQACIEGADVVMNNGLCCGGDGACGGLHRAHKDVPAHPRSDQTKAKAKVKAHAEADLCYACMALTLWRPCRGHIGIRVRVVNARLDASDDIHRDIVFVKCLQLLQEHMIGATNCLVCLPNLFYKDIFVSVAACWLSCYTAFFGSKAAQLCLQSNAVLLLACRLKR